jgi:hypothetical protein
MNCEEFRAGRLEGGDSPAGRDHLDACASCRARVGDLDSGRARLGDSAMWEEPSPELGIQVARLIGSDEPRRPRDGWRSRWPAWSTAVAAVVVVLAGAGLFLALRSSTPHWEVAMPGTEFAPNASAVVKGWNEAGGTRLVFAVEGLEPAPDGFVYEFWLSKGRLHTSAGTFTTNGEFELRTGVTRADFPRLWVTLEPLDEDESPTTRTVLDTGS